MTEKKETFVLWTPTEEAQIGRSRSLTNQEKRYIQLSNWIRLWQLIKYLFLLVLFFVGIFFAVLVLSSLIDLGDQDYLLLVIILVYIGPALIVTSLLVFALRKKIPWKISLWLSLKNLEAVELTGALGVEISDDRVWALSKTRFLMPEHWVKYLSVVYPDSGKVTIITIWAVKRKDATDKVFSYTSTNIESGTTFENHFRDYSYYALTCGPLKIDEDGKQRLPYFRANSFWIGLTTSFGLIGLLLSIYFSSKLDTNNESVVSIENTINKLENELTSGQNIDKTIFYLREIPPFTADENYGNRVLVNKKPFDYYNVSISENSRPFLLSSQEYTMIMRVSLVTPRGILGYGKPSTKALNDYRNEIKAIINKSTDITKRIRGNALNSLMSTNNTVLGQQMRSYRYRLKADLDYVQQFLPTPFLYMPPDNKYYLTTRTCYRPLFCMSLKKKQLMSRGDMAIIHTKNITDNSSIGFQIIDSQKLVKLKEYRQRREALNYKDPTIYWIQDIGAIGILVILSAVSFAVSCFQAKRQVSKHYNKKLRN